MKMTSVKKLIMWHRKKVS